MRIDLEENLKQEELIWYQQSREEWIRLGDKNTKYYHIATRVRKAQNKRYCLRDKNENVIKENDKIKSMVLEYFNNMFLKDMNCSMDNNMPNCFLKLNKDTWAKFNSPFVEEVRITLFYMTPWKTLGLDSLSARFYKKFENITCETVIKQTLEFLKSGILQEGLNDTIVSLIPKLECPEEIS